MFYYYLVIKRMEARNILVATIGRKGSLWSYKQNYLISQLKFV